MHEDEVRVYKLDEKGVPQPTGMKLDCPTPTHSLFVPQDLLDAATGSVTNTTVTHADGTTITVTTTSAAKI
eukprot:SAG22_NODE_249_length_13894_cov_60.455455_5_plen_71_part_00